MPVDATVGAVPVPSCFSVFGFVSASGKAKLPAVATLFMEILSMVICAWGILFAALKDMRLTAWRKFSAVMPLAGFVWFFATE